MPVPGWRRSFAHLIVGTLQAIAARRDKRAFHRELKRLSLLGDHLIDDIGLDPQAIRRRLRQANGDEKPIR